MTDNKPYPDLPPPDFGRARRLGAAYFGDAFTADQMRAYVDADRAMRAAEPAVAQAAPAAVARPSWEAIRKVQMQYLGITKAAVALVAAVDEQHNKEVPLKYAVPYGAVNDLREALTTTPTTQAPAVVGPVVAYRISDPNEPELGCWLSEKPGATWCKSEPLVAAALTTQPQEAAPSQDAEEAVKQCLEAGETFRALRRIVNLLLEARGTLGPEDHELRERIDALLKADAARAQQEGK